MVQRILVLCTGNSCRSIMAEALINHLGQGRMQAVSAGSHPAGSVHPQALATLQRHHIPLGTPSSKSWNVFAGQLFDKVITVCDAAANESCPIFTGPGQNPAQKLHWSIPDPANYNPLTGTKEASFDQVFDLLKKRIEILLQESRILT
ncbi:MAG: arsenate reductase ArsC [Alphaproteobacteria bacterium]|nr:arsenate reductase ArsC [Alphaproteobacteria bacterium]